MDEDVICGVVFYEHSEGSETEENDFFDNDRRLYQDWIRGAIVKERDKKLKDIVSNGIFNKHLLRSILVRLDEEDCDFIAISPSGRQEPHEPGKVYLAEVLIYPPFERVLSTLGYTKKVDYDTNRSGDYIFNANACERFTVGDLDSILQRDYVDLVSIMLKKVDSLVK